MSKMSFLSVGILRAFLGKTLSEAELQAVEKVGEHIFRRIRSDADRRAESGADEALRHLVLAAEEIRSVAKFLASEGPWNLDEIIRPESDDDALLEGWRREQSIRFSRFLLRAVAEFQDGFRPSVEELHAWRASFSEDLPSWTRVWPFEYIRPKAPRNRSREAFIYLDLGADLILVADSLRRLDRHLEKLAGDFPEADPETKRRFLGDRDEMKRSHPLALLRDNIEEIRLKVDAAAGAAENVVHDEWAEEFGSGPRPEEERR